MHLDSLRKRAVRIFTTPPEVLYAMSRHWFIILFFFCIGTLLLLARSMTEPLYYQGYASLLVNPTDTLVPEDVSQRRVRGDEVQRFLNAQADILWSDSVLRKLSNKLGYRAVLAQEENRQSEAYGSVRKGVNDLRVKIKGLVEYFRHPNVQDFGVENDLQRAIRVFRNRSKVIPDSRAGSIELQVYGNDRAQLQRELEAWVWAYNDRLDDMARESYDKFLAERITFWEAQAEASKEELDRFRTENSTVSVPTFDLLKEQLLRIEIRRSELEDAVQGRAGAIAFLAAAENPETRDLTERIKQNRIAEQNLKSQGRAETSIFIQQLRDQRKYLEDEIAKVNPSLGRVGVSEKQKEEWGKQLKLATNDLQKKIVEVSAMTGRIDDLLALEVTYSRTKETLQSYKFTSKKVEDILEEHKMVQVQIGDEPRVSTQPFEQFPYGKVPLGAFGGFAVGALLALLLEVLRTKVRFKNDIVSETGIPVIEVVMKK